MNPQSKRDVRPILAVDAVTCLAAGALMLLGASFLSPLLGLPAMLLTVAGAALLPVAALFGWMSRQPIVSPALLLMAVVGNAAWVVGSLAVLTLSKPTPLGMAFVASQAAAVAVLAMLEMRGFNGTTATA